jgi:hypothetical protein
MSSSSNYTAALSYVPSCHTPSFIQRIGSAYSAALRELLSPGTTRPDPSEVDPGPRRTMHRPPTHVEVETVYSADASTIVDHSGFVDGSAPTNGVPVAPPASSPVSLFLNHELPTGIRTGSAHPEAAVSPPACDAFSSAFLPDPGFSPIIPPTTVTRH